MKIYMKKPTSNTWILATFVIWQVCEILQSLYYDISLRPFMRAFNTYGDYFILALLSINIFCFQRYRRDELIRVALVSVPIVIATILSKNGNIMSCWLFIAASKNIELDKVIRKAEKIFIIMIPSIIILCFAGVLKNHIVMRGSVGTVRMSLGFEHPNYLGGRIFQLFICIFYRRRGVFHFLDYIFIFSAILFVYFVPNSQTAYMTLIILVMVQAVYVLLNKYTKKGVQKLCTLLIFASLFLNVFSVYMGTRDLSSNKALSELDHFLSSRFSVCYTEVKLFGINMLGQDVNLSLKERMARGVYQGLYLDNAYLSLLIRFGVVVYVIFTAAYIYNLYSCKRKNNIVLLLILFVYSVYGVFERQMYLMSYNIFMLTFASLVYNKREDINLRGCITKLCRQKRTISIIKK